MRPQEIQKLVRRIKRLQRGTALPTREDWMEVLRLAERAEHLRAERDAANIELSCLKRKGEHVDCANCGRTMDSNSVTCADCA